MNLQELQERQQHEWDTHNSATRPVESIKELKERLYELSPEGDLALGKDGRITFYTEVEATESEFHDLLTD